MQRPDGRFVAMAARGRGLVSGRLAQPADCGIRPLRGLRGECGEGKKLAQRCHIKVTVTGKSILIVSGPLRK